MKKLFLVLVCMAVGFMFSGCLSTGVSSEVATEDIAPLPWTAEYVPEESKAFYNIALMFCEEAYDIEIVSKDETLQYIKGVYWSNDISALYLGAVTFSVRVKDDKVVFSCERYGTGTMNFLASNKKDIVKLEQAARQFQSRLFQYLNNF